jgi:hypothetical protein
LIQIFTLGNSDRAHLKEAMAIRHGRITKMSTT